MTAPMAAPMKAPTSGDADQDADRQRVGEPEDLHADETERPKDQRFDTLTGKVIGKGAVRQLQYGYDLIFPGRTHIGFHQMGGLPLQFFFVCHNVDGKNEGDESLYDAIHDTD